MKKSIITLLLFFTAFLVKAQPTAGLSTGYGSKTIITQMEVGYTFFKNLYAGYDQRAYLSGRQPAYFGFKPVYFFRSGDFHCGPAAGAYYRLMSVDNKSTNGWRFGAGIKGGYKLFNAEAYVLDGRFQFTIGVFGITDLKEK